MIGSRKHCHACSVHCIYFMNGLHINSTLVCCERYKDVIYMHNDCVFYSNTDTMERRYNNARSYLLTRYPKDVFDENPNTNLSSAAYPWINKNFHKFYQMYHKEWDNSTAVLLELGGGPCIYPLISAVPYVAEIYHSDFVKACRDEVLLWKNKDPNAYDWSPYFKHVVHTLEGQTSPDAVAGRQEKLRGLLKDSVPCDCRADVIVPSVKTPVNIISSNHCLEICFNSLEEYVVGLRKIYNMIVPRGFFVSLTAIEISWCEYANTRYTSSYPLTVQDVQTHYQKAGFEVLLTDTFEEPLESRNVINDATGYTFIIARKT